jgi:hypothetical protein
MTSNCASCGTKGALFMRAGRPVCKTCFNKEDLSDYEQMIEKAIEQKYENIGMKNAGWKETPSGAMYYPDDDQPNIIHLSY